jgi:hypothetical protein
LENSSCSQILKEYQFIANSHTDNSEAIDLFNRVLEIKPNHSLTYTMIGICFYSFSWAKPFVCFPLHPFFVLSFGCNFILL